MIITILSGVAVDNHPFKAVEVLTLKCLKWTVLINILLDVFHLSAESFYFDKIEQ